MDKYERTLWTRLMDADTTALRARERARWATERHHLEDVSLRLAQAIDALSKAEEAAARLSERDRAAKDFRALRPECCQGNVECIAHPPGTDWSALVGIG